MTGQVVAPQITDRQRQTLGMLADGMGTDEMAAALHLSFAGTASRRKALYGALGARNAAHAVAIGYRTGLLGGAS